MNKIREQLHKFHITDIDKGVNNVMQFYQAFSKYKQLKPIGAHVLSSLLHNGILIKVWAKDGNFIFTTNQGHGWYPVTSTLGLAKSFPKDCTIASWGDLTSNGCRFIEDLEPNDYIEKIK